MDVTPAGEAALRGAPIQRRALRRLALGTAALAAVGIAGAGTLAGPDVGFDFLCLWPIGLATWLGGFPLGFGLSLATATTSLAAGLLARPGTGEALRLWNFAIDLGVYLSQAWLLSRLHARMDREGRLARTDEVTHIANRRAFEEAADRELERARRQRRPVTLAYLDVDDFKRLNDRFGHAAGDEVLERVGAALSRGTRRLDTAARLGGDEFGLLLPDTSESAARALLERLRASVGAAASGRGGPVSLSIGAVTFEAAPASVQEMVARADAAMYAAKRAGKGWIRVEVVRPSAAGAAPAPPAGPSASAPAAAPGPRPARPLPA
jgi:diguanylate cyclase (GGDEF)-like protein